MKLLQAAKPAELRLKTAAFLENSQSLGSKGDPLIYLQVTAPMVESNIELANDQDEVVDFGRICVENKVMRSFTIRNKTNKPVQLKTKGLNAWMYVDRECLAAKFSQMGNILSK
jgi:hypothetical protein